MYGFEHDPDDGDDQQHGVLADIAVLLIPAAIMIAGFVVAVFLL